MFRTCTLIDGYWDAIFEADAARFAEPSELWFSAAARTAVLKVALNPRDLSRHPRVSAIINATTAHSRLHLNGDKIGRTALDAAE
jgi:hypothetical protein